jgi:hypothetical protein
VAITTTDDRETRHQRLARFAQGWPPAAPENLCAVKEKRPRRSDGGVTRAPAVIIADRETGHRRRARLVWGWLPAARETPAADEAKPPRRSDGGATGVLAMGYEPTGWPWQLAKADRCGLREAPTVRCVR